MAISKFSQCFVNSGCSRRVRFAPLGALLGSVAWVILAGPAWSADLTPIFKDSDTHTQDVAVLHAAEASEQSISLVQYVADMETVQAEVLTRVAIGQFVRLEKVLLDQERLPVILELERFTVFEPDARIVVHRENGQDILPVPATAYFRGKITGRPDSLAVLSADPSGNMQGIVQDEEKFWIVAGGAKAGGSPVGLTSRELRQSGLANDVTPLQCSFDKLPAALRTPRHMASEAFIPKSLPAGQFYNVPVAIETDNEFLALFSGSTSAATSYIGNLFAYASTIYQREASSKLTVGYISLWQTADPWNHTSTLQGLQSFENYWNANRQSINRATAHFLSARSLGGGIAYLGALCSSYGYGYSANLSGDFQISNPQPVWDLVVVTHEIGHNFNSLHTHDYQGIGNNSNPVDACTSGYLPGINALSGGTPNTGNGTIMSYCHLLGGGMANIALKFGLDHQYGIAASRVSSQISSYVAAVANTNPSCISVSGTGTYPLTVAKAGTGTGMVTSSPAGINCGTGTTCSYNFSGNVILTTVPVTGSAFANWAGCDSVSGTTCTVTMSAAKTVTATFNQSTAGSDLIVTAVSSPSTGKVSGLITVSATVKNQGSASAPTSLLALMLSGDTAITLGDIDTGWGCNTGNLVAGASITCGGQIQIPANLAPGTYYFGAYADKKGVVTESDEINNGRAAANAIVVTSSQPATYALTVAKAGTGTGMVTSSPAGINCGTACSSSFSGNVIFTAVPAAGSAFASWGGCGSVSGTTCTVTMSAAKTVTATFNQSIAKSDLIVTAVSSPSTGKVSGLITVSVTVKNQGSASAPTSLLALMFSGDTAITLSDIYTGWGCNTGNLVAGASITCGGQIQIPANLALGTYYFGAYADKNGVVTESNEINNGRAAANAIVITR